MEFHERLRYLIDCEEMKIKDLAAKLHLAPSTLGNYVQGTREPDYDTLRRIADYFGVSIDYLLGHETPAVDDERQLLTCYRSFTPSQPRRFTAMRNHAVCRCRGRRPRRPAEVSGGGRCAGRMNFFPLRVIR